MKRKLFLVLSGSAAALLLFFSVSLQVHKNHRPLKQESLHIELSGIGSILAASPTEWDGVRGTATFIKDIVDSLNQILAAFGEAGVFYLKSSYETTSGSVHFKIDPAYNTTVTTGPLGSVTYQYRFEAWNVSSGPADATNKYLDFMFNSPSAGSGELLVRIKPALSPDSTDPLHADTMVECQSSGAAGSRTMICSVTAGGPIINTGASSEELDAVVMKAQENDPYIDVTAIGRKDEAATGISCATYPDYYALAYKAYDTSPYKSTARHGYNDNTIETKLCSALDTKAGFFNASASDYYVGEGTTDLPGYPTISDVDTLFATMVSGSVTKARVDSLAASAPTFEP